MDNIAKEKGRYEREKERERYREIEKERKIGRESGERERCITT